VELTALSSMSGRAIATF